MVDQYSQSDLFALPDEDQELAAGYVLGDLDETERLDFEARLHSDLALQLEVAALSTTLHQLPLELPALTPPPALGDRILTAFAEQSITPVESIPASPHRPAPTAEQPTWHSAPDLDTALGISSPQPEPLRPSRPSIPWAKLLAGAAAITAIALGLDNLSLRNQLAIASRSSDPALPSIATLLQRPKSRLVSLTNTNASLSGTLLFTPGQWQEVVVAFGELPPLPPDQVYRMWLKLANGQTIPCGEFKPDAQGKVLLRITPPQTPPKGVKATGVFVTLDATNAPLEPTNTPLLSGTI